MQITELEQNRILAIEPTEFFKVFVENLSSNLKTAELLLKGFSIQVTGLFDNVDIWEGITITYKGSVFDGIAVDVTYDEVLRKKLENVQKSQSEEVKFQIVDYFSNNSAVYLMMLKTEMQIREQILN